MSYCVMYHHLFLSSIEKLLGWKTSTCEKSDNHQTFSSLHVWLFVSGSLTCKSRICLDGGELEGHLMLVSVDDQMLL